MNIFYLDECPQIAAQYHNNRHVVKMILEQSQILSTAHHILDGPNENLYKPTHKNHPSAIWARTNRSNYWWLFQLYEALLEEYTYRYGKIHASSRLLPYLAQFPKNLPDGDFFEPPLAMEAQYKLDNALSSYRNYYIHGKSHLAQWKIREKPWWYI